MSTRIDILERVPADVHIPIVVKDQPRVRDQRVGRDEGAQRRVIVPGVVIQEPGAVLFLAGEACPELDEGVGASSNVTAACTDGS
jgi:hypothetical protein